ncbi:ATP-binding protein [Arachidicoccus soli]|uniref:ATP-binding protein n=1 Tax=Arachidicoccus soli TaxID=2341117 RepID=A0A386HRD3_9BACT|nr:ATP-binding protein [Arachidicoccus soli]AYD48232.1 ATP-binding protein [Arachidicoccus soli]
MTQQQKTEIQTMLKQFIEQFPSQSKAAANLKGVSEATIIQLLKGRWESISDEMFTSIGKQVGYDAKGVWHLVETLGMNTIITIVADAKEYGNVFALIGNTGNGKSEVPEWYASKKENTFVVSCAEHFNKKTFLNEMFAAMGKDGSGYGVAEMMDGIVETVLRMKEPVFYLDEYDKLKDEVFLFFITIYNRLEGKCGLIIAGTEVLEKRIKKGVRLSKKGYSEIYSRVGRSFIHVPPPSKREIAEICEVNGCDDQQTIAEICNTCEGDIRRVKRAIHKYKLMQALKAA